MRHALALAATLLAAAFALVACGEDQATTTVEAAAEDNGDGARRIVVEGDGTFSAQAVYERAAPGVVTVSSLFKGETALGSRAGQGSGFVLNSGGEIVTNAHVVTDGQANGGSEINEASEVYVQFPDRNQVEAEIVGFDPYADVALLRVEPRGLDLAPLELGDLEDVGVGEPVAAIGSPFGEDQSLSVGVISALDRAIPSLTEFDILGAIQTDASINPGNSGGPLLDAEGRVVGINQQIDTTSGGNQGVGFAVPIDLVQRSVEQLREDGEVEYAFLGVATRGLFPQLAERLDIDAKAGALVERVEPASPAERAGIEAGDQRITFQGTPYRAGGDVIVAMDGVELDGESDLAELVSRATPGDVIVLDVIRGDERRRVEVELSTRPGG